MWFGQPLQHRDQCSLPRTVPGWRHPLGPHVVRVALFGVAKPRSSAKVFAMISFTCPACNKQLKIKDELAGKRVRCPGCATVLPVPTQVVASTPGRRVAVPS